MIKKQDIEEIHSKELQLVPVHKYQQYLEQTCNLINSEWKRSVTARMHSLCSSCDELPTNLILIKSHKVIGHVRLTSIPMIKEACLIQSVVIDKSIRGKGLGRRMLQMTEEYCRNININTIYLTTIDKEEFYSKCGYRKCSPISIYGNADNLTNSKREPTKAAKQQPNRTNNIPAPPLPNYLLTINDNIKQYMKKKI